MAKAFLTDRARDALVHYVAVNGESYEGYQRFAEAQGWKLFTKAYLHNWVGRHRRQIHAERERHLFDLRRVSLLDRQKRLSMLESASLKLQDLFEQAILADDREQAAKLAEQMRKQLQSVAVERGEWQQKDDKQQLDDIKQVLLENMAQMALPDPDVVEGSFHEVTVETPSLPDA